jgi:hypothetical protein
MSQSLLHYSGKGESSRRKEGIDVAQGLQRGGVISPLGGEMEKPNIPKASV